MPEIVYDSNGRMTYNPEFHFNHGKPYTLSELVYICQQYKMGSRKALAMAVGRTEATLASVIYRLKQNGEFEYYKNLTI